MHKFHSRENQCLDLLFKEMLFCWANT